MAQGVPIPGELVTQEVIEWLGVWGSLDEFTLILWPKKKALSKLQWHPTTCTHPAQDCKLSLQHLPLPSPNQYPGDTAPWGVTESRESTVGRGCGSKVEEQIWFGAVLSCPVLWFLQSKPSAHLECFSREALLEEGPRPFAPGESSIGKYGVLGQRLLSSSVQSLLAQQ